MIDDHSGSSALSHEQINPGQMTEENVTGGASKRQAGRENDGLIGGAVGFAGAAAERYLAEHKDRLADIISEIADEAQKSGRRFEGEQDWLANVIDKGAGKARDAAENLRSAEVAQLIKQAGDLARRNPKLFAAGAAIVGLVAVRFAKHALRDTRSTVKGAYRVSE